MFGRTSGSVHEVVSFDWGALSCPKALASSKFMPESVARCVERMIAVVIFLSLFDTVFCHFLIVRPQLS